MMNKSLRGTIFENRRFLWTAAISFAVAAVLFPMVVLAAFGHFSRANETPSQVRDVRQC